MIAILYAAKNQLSPTHYPVMAWITCNTRVTIWVRPTILKSGDVETALAQAKPRKGEIVLNAIELEGDAK